MKQLFLKSIILAKIGRRNSGNGKPPREKHHSNNCFRQESPMKAKISECKYDGKHDIYMVSKYTTQYTC